MDVNRVTLIGRLVHKPMLVDGVATVSIATNYMWKDHKTKDEHNDTQFHLCSVGGELAKLITTKCDKGQRLYIEGKINGTGKEIIIEEAIMLGKVKEKVSS